MKITQLGSVNDGNSSSTRRGYTVFGKITEILKHPVLDPVTKIMVSRDALRVQIISGKEPNGREIFVVQKIDPNSKVMGLDEAGRISKKVKVGSTVAVVRAFSVKAATEDALGTVEADRIIKVGSNFAADKSVVVISTYRADINRVAAFAATPKDGIFAELLEDKSSAVEGVLSEVADKIVGDQALLLVINATLSDGSAITLQSIMPRFSRVDDKAPWIAIPLADYKTNVSEFVSKATARNFDGTIAASILDALDSNDVKIFVAPVERLRISKPSYLIEHGQAIVAGAGIMGVAIAPATEDRDWALLTPGSMEAVGSRVFKRKDGKHVIHQDDNHTFYTLVNQCETMNGRPRIVYEMAAPGATTVTDQGAKADLPVVDKPVKADLPVADKPADVVAAKEAVVVTKEVITATEEAQVFDGLPPDSEMPEFPDFPDFPEGDFDAGSDPMGVFDEENAPAF